MKGLKGLPGPKVISFTNCAVFISSICVGREGSKGLYAHSCDCLRVQLM